MTVSVFMKRGKSDDSESQIVLFTFGSNSWRAFYTCIPSSLIPGRRLHEVHVPVQPDGVWHTVIDGAFFCRESVSKIFALISVPPQLILHNTSLKVRERYVLIDTAIQNPGILHGHINSPCKYWLPPLFTTKSSPVCIVILIYLVGPSNKFLCTSWWCGIVNGDTFLYLAGVLAEHLGQLRPR